MDRPAAGQQGIDAVTWALVLGVAGFVLVTGPMLGFRFVPVSFAGPLAATLLLAGLSAYYGAYRGDAHLGSALGATSQIIAFAAVGAPLSYVAAASGAHTALYDSVLDRADQTLLFDWLWLREVLTAWPVVHALMRCAYLSLIPQMIVAVLLLGFCGRLMSLRVFTLAFMFSALICIGVSAALPAEGVWLFQHLETGHAGLVPVSGTSWPVFLGLRDGSFRLLVASGAEGIITFPSFHAALGALLTLAFWEFPRLRWPVLALNALMLISTPLEGSHYLSDVLAGLCVAGASWFAASRLVARFAAAPQRQPAGESVGAFP